MYKHTESKESFYVKWSKARHDPSQILMKLFQMKGLYKIRFS